MAPLEGWARLNRDARGGTLEDLLPALDALLAAGAERVVLDNTYPSRAARNAVIETAWAHGAIFSASSTVLSESIRMMP